MRLKALAVAGAAAALAGCGGNAPVTHVPFPVREAGASPGAPKKLAVFLDGTANDEGTYTNVARLYNLTSLQADTSVSAVYIEGVGTGGKVIGMMTGWGIGQDVRQAYRYLGENYRPDMNDQVFIFGFSRGAYAARILAALIHTAGIPNLRAVPERDRDRLVRRIYAAYKSRKDIAGRKQDVQRVLGYLPPSVPVEFMGLWDTVEALGLPDYKERIDERNPRYADQLCNVRKAAHAVSIDDDRARIFTPVLLTRDSLVAQCESPVDLDAVVDEVWFSGAHRDVGGGYRDTDIDGVSLNWMLELLAPYGLVPRGTRVHADPCGRTHDPESGAAGLIYRKRTRSIGRYADSSSYNGGRLKIHRSVVERLAHVRVQPHESHWFQSPKYQPCFRQVGDVLQYRESAECARVVELVPARPEAYTPGCRAHLPERTGMGPPARVHAPARPARGG